MEELAAFALKEFGKIDVLVNNAGVMPQSFLHKLKILSSIDGHNVYASGTVYCATKHAVRAITEGLRQEEAMSGTNIRTTNISPGAVSKELTEGITDVELKQAYDELYKGAIKAESMARAIAFAIEEPEDVAINEMIIRPTRQQA